MAITNPSNPTCVNCNKSGLAILPVRYAVVPIDIKTSLPAPLGMEVSTVKLAHHHYALRTLREGFLYLFHEKHARGSQIKWEVYSVAPSGTLWKQPSPHAMIPTDKLACATSGHNLPASVISIERPDMCGRVWIAFSEHPWSAKTFARFQNDVAARSRRMQVIDPDILRAGGSYEHGLLATEENVGKILEYQHTQAYAAIAADGPVPRISKADYTVSMDLLKKQTSRYAFHNRKGQTSDVVRLMSKLGENPGSKPNAPVVIALWDAIGITNELSGFAHDAIGWVEKYDSERAQEVDAMQKIEGLKEAFNRKAIAAEQNLQQRVLSTGIQSVSAERRASAQKLPEPKRTQMLQYYDITDDWARRQLDMPVYQTQLIHAHMQAEPQRSQQIRTVCAEVDQFLAKRDKIMKERQAKARTDLGNWTHYEDNINGKLYKKFKDNHDGLLHNAHDLVEHRIGDLIAWLESPSLLAALSEFDPDDPFDQSVFNEQISEAVYGMNISVKGGAKLDNWVAEMKATESNLLWRAIAQNDTHAIAALNEALADAQKFSRDRTLASTINWVNYGSKTLKALADTYKKFNSVETANKSATDGKAIAAKVPIKPVNTGGIDKLVVTAGDRIFRAFADPGLADYAGEKIIQHVMSLRAFIPEADSIALIKAQTKEDRALRAKLLQELREARPTPGSNTPFNKPAQSAELKGAWDKLKSAGNSKDARLALLVMLIEGLNFSKLIADCAMKNDAKSWWLLTASGMSIASNLFDIASIPAKVVFANPEAWSYQSLKLTGGLLSSSASAIGAVFDFKEAGKNRGRGNSALQGLYLSKGILGAANAGLTLATTFSYAGPLVYRLTGRAAISTAIEGLSIRAAAIIGARVLFMTAGAWITVVTFGVQIIIWTVEDDALETWCSLCLFGNKNTVRDAYKSQPAQQEAFEKAIAEVGL